jgi:L-asparaginase
VTPGFPAKVIRERLLEGLEGLVLTVFPSGTAPTHDPEFIELLKAARKKGVPVVLATESISESGGISEANPAVYAAGQSLLREGAHWAGAMTPECAFVKTAWILAQENGAQDFGRWWAQEFAGEGA